MSPTSGSSRLDQFLTTEITQQIPSLALLYDRWANSLDPSPSADAAEASFHEELTRLFDFVVQHGPPEAKSVTFRDFRRYLISKCRWHLAATYKPPTV